MSGSGPQNGEEEDLQRLVAIRRNLDEAKSTFNESLVKLAERGNTLEQTEQQTEALLNSAEDFHHAALPGWRRWLRRWWPPNCWWCPACCCCRGGRRRHKVRFV